MTGAAVNCGEPAMTACIFSPVPYRHTKPLHISWPFLNSKERSSTKSLIKKVIISLDPGVHVVAVRTDNSINRKMMLLFCETNSANIV